VIDVLSWSEFLCSWVKRTMLDHIFVEEMLIVVSIVVKEWRECGYVPFHFVNLSFHE
jgi:hypothetical protein